MSRRLNGFFIVCNLLKIGAHKYYMQMLVDVQPGMKYTVLKAHTTPRGRTSNIKPKPSLSRKGKGKQKANFSPSNIIQTSNTAHLGGTLTNWEDSFDENEGNIPWDMKHARKIWMDYKCSTTGKVYVTNVFPKVKCNYLGQWLNNPKTGTLLDLAHTRVQPLCPFDTTCVKWKLVSKIFHSAQ
ncbi:hypothetical protein PILCRDRAFT_93429 [Piloderma croceum F 1598]|uniref:Uncharacterized protein n=1 Tax=Piloderma croceum (strain F 1598) TaxID=765440 RepID=A0A0C3B5H7_PILCF|nr:hypothetical protein PILCRDRAFT_93429 [Piloderma croceum F 1598]